MKTHISSRTHHALTLIEVLFVIASLALLVLVVLVGAQSAKNKAARIDCANNLKQVALSFRFWNGANNDLLRRDAAGVDGSTLDSAAGGGAWLRFLVMSNELGTPKTLICQADTRRPAVAWSSLANSNVSYFVGLDTDQTHPNSLLVGDSNLEVDGKTVTSGLLNLWTNSAVGWTAERHKRQGNVALADGSVQQFSNAKFREALVNTGLATNRLAIP